jgi:hypothetical protein
MIALNWQSASQARQVIPSSKLFHKESEVPITGDLSMIDFIDVPMEATDLV